MSEIKITRSHTLPLDKARIEAEKFAGQLREKFDLEYAWTSDRIEFHRQGVTGFVEVGKSDVHIEVTLGLLLSFLKPTIEGHIQTNLDQIFGATMQAKAQAKTPAKPTGKIAAKTATKKAGRA